MKKKGWLLLLVASLLVLAPLSGVADEEGAVTVVTRIEEPTIIPEREEVPIEIVTLNLAGSPEPVTITVRSPEPVTVTVQPTTEVPPVGPTTYIDIPELEAKLDFLEVKIDELEIWMEEWFFWLDGNVNQTNINIQIIFNLFFIFIDITNNIRVTLNQLTGAPLPTPCPPPDPTKITYTTGGGPLPDIPWTATIEGKAGAVEPNAVIIITSSPKPRVVRYVNADENGAFSLTMTTGNVLYFWFEVAQLCKNGQTSPTVRIYP